MVLQCAPDLIDDKDKPTTTIISLDLVAAFVFTIVLFLWLLLFVRVL